MYKHQFYSKLYNPGRIEDQGKGCISLLSNLMKENINVYRIKLLQCYNKETPFKKYMLTGEINSRQGT